MTARLIIHESAADLGVGNACAAVISGISVNADKTFVPALTRNLNDIASRLAGLCSNPIYNGFARQLERLGYPETTSACEKILKHFVSNGVRSINNVVDAYNAVAIKHSVSVGVHTFDRQQDIHVYRAQSPVRIRPLFSKKEVAIPPGDLVYSAGDNTLATIGKIDADAHDFRLTENTRNLVVVVLGHEDTSYEFNKGVIEELIESLVQAMPELQYEYMERRFPGASEKTG